MEKLGLTDKQISTIKNYEAAGGKFKRKEDLKKFTQYPILNIKFLSHISTFLHYTNQKLEK